MIIHVKLTKTNVGMKKQAKFRYFKWFSNYIRYITLILRYIYVILRYFISSVGSKYVLSPLGA